MAGESLSHDRQRGRAWPRLLSRPANPLRHSSSGRAAPPHNRRCRVSPSVPPLTGRSPSRERRTSSTDQQHRSSENQKNTGTLEGDRKTGRLLQASRPAARKNSLRRLVLSAFCTAEDCRAVCSAPFSAPPPFDLLLEASRRGACPLALPPPRPVRGTGSLFWLRARELFPQKEAPTFSHL